MYLCSLFDFIPFYSLTRLALGFRISLREQVNLSVHLLGGDVLNRLLKFYSYLDVMFCHC